MIGARGLTHDVKLLELHHLDECVEMLHLRRDTVVALWIIRHAVAQPIGRENAKSLAEPSKNRKPKYLRWTFPTAAHRESAKSLLRYRHRNSVSARRSHPRTSLHGRRSKRKAKRFDQRRRSL